MKKHLSNQTRKRMLSILGMLLLSVPFVLAQVLVKGTVKDNLGEGVPGASVQVKGTSQGTITDLDGKFTLNIPQKNATLVISFIELELADPGVSETGCTGYLPGPAAYTFAVWTA